MHSDPVPLTSHLQRQLSRALPLLPLVISRAYVPYRFPYPDSGFILCHYGSKLIFYDPYYLISRSVGLATEMSFSLSTPLC